MSGNPDVSLVKAVQSVQKFADDYVDAYELEADEGSYTPNEQEQMLITDAINGLIADEDFLRLVRSEVDEREKLRKERGECVICGCKLPEHWGGCSSDNGDAGNA